MRQRLLLLAALAVASAAACSRSFPTAVTPSPLSSPAQLGPVAPRGRLTLSASGGVPPYSFRLAGAPKSGPHAAVTGDSYQAGELGSATDTVAVSDSAGAQTTTLIVVGPALALSPTHATAAPDAQVAFSASGGAPPYAFSLTDCGAGHPSGGAISEDGGLYVAGPTGLGALDCVEVTDATQDPLARATAEVTVIAPLALAPMSAQVAPRGRIVFTASGGAGGYTFSFVGDAGSGEGATLDGGDYQAGASGPSTDVVGVTDVDGNLVQATVSVTARLTVSAGVSTVEPGGTVQVNAAGGMPPYVFSVAGCLPDGGSGASINPDTGLYTAGPRGNAQDCVQVSDATRDPLATASLTLSVGAPLTLSPALAVVPPRGRALFTASGGTGVYTFSFVGSPQSGEGATLDGGAYQAGANGPAQDVIAVNDGVAQVTAVASVSARLAIAPALALAEPAGPVQFEASGGAPPYAYALVGCDGSDGGSGATLDGGLYRAGLTANSTDCVEVSDSTRDPLATAEATVKVGAGLLLRPTAPLLTASPGSTIDFVALGGQPPYAFSLAGVDGGSGATVDPVTGVYTAGTRGSTEDAVTVTDANGVQVVQRIAVGPALAAAALTGDLFPGVPVSLFVSGGQAPYTYGFAYRGNHSDGTLDAVTGTYTPGLNYGAVDSLEVTDSAGAVVPIAGLPVGALQAGVGSADRLVVGDFNGDGLQDVAEVIVDGWPVGPTLEAGLEVVLASSSGLPTVIEGTLDPANPPLDLFAADLNGDGHTDLIEVTPTTVSYLLSGADGSPGAPVVAMSRVQPTFALGFGVFAPARGGATYFGAEGPGGWCGAGGGVATVTWVAGDPTPGTPQCAFHTTGQVNLLATGDWNADGVPDVAWIQLDEGNGIVHFADGPAWTPSSSTVSLPASAPAYFRGLGYPSSQIMPVLPAAGGDLLAVLLLDSTSLLTEGVLVSPAAATVSSPIEIMSGGAEFLLSIDTGAAGVPNAFGAIDDHTGQVQAYLADAGALVPLGPLAPVGPNPPLVDIAFDGVATPDFNGDGVADLVGTGGGSPETAILFGEGDGTFGRLERSRITYVAATGDLDGDGLVDIVELNDQTLQVLYGDRRQLAYGPPTPLTSEPYQLSVGAFGLDGGAGVLEVGLSGGGEVLLPGVDGGLVQAYTLLTADGGPFPVTFGINPGEFGGAAAGADLWTGNCYLGLDDHCGVLVFVRGDPGNPGSFTTLEDDVMIGGAPVNVTNSGSCQFLGANLAGQAGGVEDLVALCSTETSGVGSTDLLVATATSGGNNLAFSPWQVLAHVGSASTAIGTLGSGVGWAAFIAAQSRTTLWTAAGSAGTEQPVSFAVPTYPIGTSGPLGPGGALALATTGADGRVHFFDGAPDAGFIERASSLAAAGVVVTPARVGGGAASDLVMESGTDLVIHPNDGGQLY